MGPFKERNNRLRGYHRIKSYEPLLCKRRQHFLTEGVALMAITMFLISLFIGFSVFDYVSFKCSGGGVRLLGTIVTDT